MTETPDSGSPDLELASETSRLLLNQIVSDLTLMGKRFDHLDVQLHEIRQFIDDNRPVLARAQRFMRNPVADYLKKPKGAPRG
jgi:chitinase